MVSFNSSTTGGKILLPGSSRQQRHASRGMDAELLFSLNDNSAPKVFPLRQQQLGTKCRCLPLAALTTVGQQLQPLQQLQSLSCRQTSNKLPDNPEVAGQASKGLISIGLLQLCQPGGARGQLTPLGADAPTLQDQEQDAPNRQHRKHHRHKQHHSSDRQQDCCQTEAAAHAKAPSQQEQQHKSQQDASGSPIAGLLAQVTRAKLLVAGAASAVVSRTAMAPLERVKMDLLLKTSSRSALDTAVWVWQREGIAGFWKGNGLNLLRTAPFKALNFCSFDVYSKALSGVMSDGSNSARFLAGAMAGITATLICFPLDVLRTRLMAPWGHKYGGPLTTLKCMVKYEGPGALYAGVVPAVIGMAPSGAVFYGVYDLLKARHLAELNSSSSGSSGGQQQQQQHELPVRYTLLYGALAGAAAETFLYPLEVIRRKMQLQSMAAGAAVLASPGNAAAAAAPNLLRQHGLKAASGALVPTGAGMGGFGAAGVPGAAAMARIAAACSAIMRADGLAGFYAGLLPNMLQVLPSAALSYGTYESVKQMLGAV